MRTRRMTMLVALVGATLLMTAAVPSSADPEHLPTDPDFDPVAAGGSGAQSPFAAGPGSRNLKLLDNEPQGDFTNSDLAFWDDIVVAGNYGGFRIFANNPSNPKLLADVECFGPQNDVSVWENLLFLSVDAVLTGPECGNGTAADPRDPTNWEGVRVFDISDPTDPQYVTAVATDCGSHTHTLVPDTENGRVLLYVSSYALRPGPNCGPDSGADDPLHNQISIVEVPLADPASASVIAEPPVSGEVFDLSAFGLDPTFGCHDIQVFLELDLAAAACLSEGQLWDISDRANPDTLGAVRIDNDAVEIWHSAAFTWDGETVVFGDESIFGSCNSPDEQDGRLWFHDVDDPAVPIGSFLIPRNPGGYCSAHLFNVLPKTDGRDVLVSSWYAGGMSVIDFTDPADPVEVAWYQPDGGSMWAGYWHNGFVHGNDIPRGYDVFLLSDNARARTLRFDHLNPQTQYELIP